MLHVHDVLNTPNSRVHDVLNTLRVHDVLDTDNLVSTHLKHTRTI
jgi:hypothetical protein